MTKVYDNLDSITFVAIDIAKAKNDLLIQTPGRKRYRMKITNEQVDHDHLVEHLVAIGGIVEVGFEATGNYHRPLVWRLLSAGFNLNLISSVALARTREALHPKFGFTSVWIATPRMHTGPEVRKNRAKVLKTRLSRCAQVGWPIGWDAS